MKFDYKEMLVRTAEEMNTLARKIDENGTESLSKDEMSLLRLGTVGTLREIMKEIEFLYITGSHKAIYNFLDDMNIFLQETF